MKAIAIICVMVGVGVAAAFGSRNINEVRDRQNTVGRLQLLGGAVEALEAEAAETGTTAERKTAIAAEITALAPKLAEAQAAKAKIPPEAVEASTRLSGWFSANGLPFSAGVLLIIFGGLLARRADKTAMQAALPGGVGAKKDAVDFGVKLVTTAATVRTLYGVMSDVKARSVAGLEPFKSQVEAIIQNDIEPLIETKHQVIGRFGMAGFAQLFGPLSGAERYLNRAWVAMVDRHWDEAQNSLDRAAQGLEDTIAELETLKLAET